MSAQLDGAGRGPSSAAALAATLVVVLCGLLADAVMAPSSASLTTTAVTQQLAGRPTCAAGASGEGNDLVAASVADVGLADRSAAFASLEVQSSGLVRTLASPDTTGSAVAAAISGAEGDVLVAARWHEVPLLLSRRWTLGDGARVPGAVEGPCPDGTATRWVVPGVATAGGASAQLHLANPTDGSASVAVTFTTPNGLVAPTRLANLVVGAHDRVTIELNEFAPEEPDLGVIVEARTGQVVVEAVQGLEAAVGGVDGRSLVVAHAELGAVWTVPWVSASEVESSWVWITNPSETVAEVGLVVHTAAGPIVPPTGGITLRPGETQRVDLRGALGEVAVGGITVRSESGVDIAVSGAVIRAVEGNPVRGGIAVVEASVAGPGRAAVLSAIGAAGHTRELTIANPGDVEAAIRIVVVGRDASTPVVLAEELRIAPGGWISLPLADALPSEGAFAVLVDVFEGVAVAGMIGLTDEGPLELTAIVARRFAGTVEAQSVQAGQNQTLLHPLVSPSEDSAPDDGVVDADNDADG